MQAYGFSEDFLTFLYSCLKCGKQSVNVSNVHRMFQIPLSGVLQGSILGPLLLNIFINDLFYLIKDAHILYFVDNNAIPTFSNSVDVSITKL